MSRKLVIVNNGLRNLSGHYFETAVSIADAARKLGYRPILAVHVTCPRDILPDWLECYPIFCTDHWMVEPGPSPPDLRGLLGSMTLVAHTPIEAVLDGRRSIRDYLRARIEPFIGPPDCEDVSPVPPLEPAPLVLELPPVAEAPSPSPVPEPPLSWKARIKQVGRTVIPAPLLPAARWMWKRLRSARALVLAVTNRVQPPAAPAEPPAATPEPVPQAPEAVAAPLPSVPDPAPLPPPVEDALRRDLMQVGAGHEFDYMMAFRRDLERVLCLIGADSGDHVFLPTAHGRELAAVRRLVDDLHPQEPPTFHLEFRHALHMSEDPNWVHPYTTQHQLFFTHCRRHAPHSRVRVYTDTEELTEEYSLGSGLGFQTLPIPFRTHFLAERRRRPDEPLCLAFFGDVRDEKGFHWLPPLIDALHVDYVAPGKVRFVVQASLGSPQYNPKSQEALLRLKEMDPRHVTLVGADGPLAPDDYYRLVSESDLLLCPYSPHTYRRRSSGTLTEGIAAGIPTIVPRGTWLERQQPAGTGESFTDLESFLAGVRRICEHYPRYLKAAQAFKNHWLGVHSPENLVRVLVGGSEEPAQGSAGKAA